MQTFSCPGCGSKIATDGQALVERSDRLTELEKVEGQVPKIVAEVRKLRVKLKEASASPAPGPGPKLKGKSKVKMEGEDAQIWSEFFEA